MSQFANLFYELGLLSKIQRSGLAFLGTGRQSVAEHTCRMLGVAFVLARLSDEPVDELRLLKLVLFHDLHEARTGDLNWVNHKYVRINSDRLEAEVALDWPFASEIIEFIKEYETGNSTEAILAGDADQLEFLITLREQADLGNPRAASWIPSLLARLKTVPAQQLARDILDTPLDDWWFSNKQDSHWIDRGQDM